MNLRLDEFQCLALSLFKHKFGRIQEGVKAFASEEGLKKKTWGENKSVSRKTNLEIDTKINLWVIR